MLKDERFILKGKFENWIEKCQELKQELNKIDNEEGNKIINKISSIINEDAIITTDVGQNQVWVSQSFKVKNNQRILFSGGLGSMGYSLPAAIGTYYAKKGQTICFTGDRWFANEYSRTAIFSKRTIANKNNCFK